MSEVMLNEQSKLTGFCGDNEVQIIGTWLYNPKEGRETWHSSKDWLIARIQDLLEIGKLCHSYNLSMEKELVNLKPQVILSEKSIQVPRQNHRDVPS